MPDFAIHQCARNDADHFAAGFERRIGHGAHQSDFRTAVHEADPAPRERAGEIIGGLAIRGFCAGTRSGKDADAPQRTHAPGFSPACGM